VALSVRPLWWRGVAAIFSLRIDGRFQGRIRRLANISVLAVVVYIVTTVATSGLAERQVAAWLAERKDVPTEIIVEYAPGNPFLRDVVVADAEHHQCLEVDWLAAESVRITHPPIERGREGPITRAAISAPQLRGPNIWRRLPAYRVQRTEDGNQASISDVRIARRAGSELGAAVVELDRDLRVTSC